MRKRTTGRNCLGLDGTGSGDTLLGELALVKADNVGGLGLGDLSGGLGEEDLSVNGVTLVRVDTTVSTERATTGLGGLLDDDVADDKLLDLETLGLGVSLSVLEEGKEELDRLDGPSTYWNGKQRVKGDEVSDCCGEWLFRLECTSGVSLAGDSPDFRLRRTILCGAC